MSAIFIVVVLGKDGECSWLTAEAERRTRSPRNTRGTCGRNLVAPAFAFFFSHAPRSLGAPLALRFHHADPLPFISLFTPSLVIAEALSVFSCLSPLTASFISSLLSSVVVALIVILHDTAQRCACGGHPCRYTFARMVKQLLRRDWWL